MFIILTIDVKSREFEAYGRDPRPDVLLGCVVSLFVSSTVEVTSPSLSRFSKSFYIARMIL